MKEQTETLKKKASKAKKKKAGGRTSGDNCAKSKAKRKKLLLETLRDNLGIVSRACKMAKISRSEFYKWRNADPKFKAAIEDVNEIALDYVEERHYALITALNPASIIFHLKTKGRGRGYKEHTEIEHSGKLGVKMTELTNDQLADIISGKDVQLDKK